MAEELRPRSAGELIGQMFRLAFGNPFKLLTIYLRGRTAWFGAALFSLLLVAATGALAASDASRLAADPAVDHAAADDGAADDRVEEALRSIFAQPGYDGIEVENESTLDKVQDSQRLLGRAWAWFTSLMTRFSLLRGTSPVAFWCIFIALNIVLVLLLWHIAYVMRGAFRRPAVAAESAQDRAERVRRSGEFAAMAEAEAARGSFGEAQRNLLLAVFARFAERNQRLVPISKTNREVLTRLPVEQRNREELAWLVGSVDDAWYGKRPATAADFNRGRTLVRHIAERGR